MNKTLDSLYKEIFANFQDKPEKAALMCLHYIEQDAGNIDVWKLYANCTKRIGQKEQCLQAAKKIIELEGMSEQALMYWLSMAAASANVYEVREAVSGLNTLNLSPAALMTLAQVANQYDLPEAAIEAADKLLLLDSKHFIALDIKATASLFLGRLDQAEKLFEKVVSLNGVAKEHALYMLSTVRKWTKEKNHIDRIKQQLNQTEESGESYPSLAYALAKELEDIKDFDQAFEWYRKGAETMKTRGNYQVETDRSIFEALKGFSRLNSYVESDSEYTPIFILGLPRTGSTLIERILSSHSQVETFGETSAFLSSFNVAINDQSRDPMSLLKTIKATQNFDFSSLAKSYVSKLYGNNSGKSEGVFIEKLPTNMYFAGVLLRAFPRAKIIYTDRNPLDTCLSNYKQIFAMHAWPYSYDLKEIADQYILANENIDYWSAQFPERVLKVSYEDVVTEPKSSIDKLLSFCGLSYEEACYSPEKNSSVSSTASSSQIRSPINKGSLHKWKKFEKHFQGVKAYFESKGVVVE